MSLNKIIEFNRLFQRHFHFTNEIKSNFVLFNKVFAFFRQIIFIKFILVLYKFLQDKRKLDFLIKIEVTFFNICALYLREY